MLGQRLAGRRPARPMARSFRDPEPGACRARRMASGPGCGAYAGHLPARDRIAVGGARGARRKRPGLRAIPGCTARHAGRRGYGSRLGRAAQAWPPDHPANAASALAGAANAARRATCAGAGAGFRVAAGADRPGCRARRAGATRTGARTGASGRCRGGGQADQGHREQPHAARQRGVAPAARPGAPGRTAGLGTVGRGEEARATGRQRRGAARQRSQRRPSGRGDTRAARGMEAAERPGAELERPVGKLRRRP